MICPHCNLVDSAVWHKAPIVIGSYRLCMRCAGISVYYETAKFKVRLRKANSVEFDALRRLPEIHMLHSIRAHFKGVY